MDKRSVSNDPNLVAARLLGIGRATVGADGAFFYTRGVCPCGGETNITSFLRKDFAERAAKYIAKHGTTTCVCPKCGNTYLVGDIL